LNRLNEINGGNVVNRFTIFIDEEIESNAVFAKIFDVN
jgi:hypothetical protein